jgi:hypothetical protein
MKRWLKTLVLVLYFSVFYTLTLFAQPGDPGGDPDVPLGGIELLIAAGAMFGAKKWFDKGKNR